MVAIPDGLVRLAPHWPNAAGEAAALDEALSRAASG
jgi:hypothetical protein